MGKVSGGRQGALRQGAPCLSTTTSTEPLSRIVIYCCVLGVLCGCFELRYSTSRLRCSTARLRYFTTWLLMQLFWHIVYCRRARMKVFFWHIFFFTLTYYTAGERAWSCFTSHADKCGFDCSAQRSRGPPRLFHLGRVVVWSSSSSRCR